MTTARKSVKPQAVKPQAEPEVKCTRVEGDAVRAPEPALPVAAEYDPGPPPIQCGVGRPRVPPAHHEDGRKRAGDYVLGAVRLQAETAAKPGVF
jgi:hypothetical protein